MIDQSSQTMSTIGAYRRRQCSTKKARTTIDSHFLLTLLFQRHADVDCNVQNRSIAISEFIPKIDDLALVYGFVDELI